MHIFLNCSSQTPFVPMQSPVTRHFKHQIYRPCGNFIMTNHEYIWQIFLVNPPGMLFIFWSAQHNVSIKIAYYNSILKRSIGSMIVYWNECRYVLRHRFELTCMESFQHELNSLLTDPAKGTQISLRSFGSPEDQILRIRANSIPSLVPVKPPSPWACDRAGCKAWRAGRPGTTCR